MTYETAKKLKDAGFPQRPGITINPKGETENVYLFHKGACALPTLSELIEACGPGIRLENLTENGVVNNGGVQEWHAFFNDRSIEIFLGKGSTPEEAVANLWLALYPQPR